MDVILQKADEYLLTPYVYPETWAEDDIVRQSISLFAITCLGGYILYLGIAGFCYETIFDKRLLKHPKMQDGQAWKEIGVACRSIPFMCLLNTPFFVAEVRGWTKLYDSVSERSLEYTLFSMACFFMWNDCIIYWVHRGLHHPLVYKHIHKEHHRWLVCTPFASHAFHPIDGFSQGVAYNLFIFVMPFNKWIHLGAFVFVNIWTILIHSGDMFKFVVPSFLEEVINGDAHHIDHHLYFNYNHGQFFTLWDRIGGTYRKPSAQLGKGPLDDLAKTKTL